MNLQGKNVLITRATDPLAAGIAQAFVEAGANLILAYDNDSVQVATLATRLQVNGRRVLAVSGNVAQPQQADQLLSQCIDSLGKLDIAVLAALPNSTQAVYGTIAAGICNRTQQKLRRPAVCGPGCRPAHD